MRYLALAALLLTLGTTPSFANYMDGNELYEDCASANDAYVKQGICLGYLQGVVDTLDMVRETNGVAQCIPTGTRVRQVVDVVLAYLRAHPAERSMEAQVLVVAAIGGAWSCRVR